jgi:hypothetical protein
LGGRAGWGLEWGPDDERESARAAAAPMAAAARSRRQPELREHVTHLLALQRREHLRRDLHRGWSGWLRARARGRDRRREGGRETVGVRRL